MKKLVTIFAIFFGLTTFAQDLKKVDGIYYAGSEPYTGEYTTYYDNDNVKMEAHFVDGMKDGKCKLYFENGKINEIHSYKKNEMHGTWLTFNTKGIKVAEANYKKGQKDGEWNIWNDEGQLVYEMHYIDGEKTGTWKNYDEMGLVVNERNYSEL